MSAPSKAASGSPAIDRIFNSSLDATIAHFNRVLATAGGIDSTLMVTGYSLALLSSQLNKLADFNVRKLAEKMAATAAQSLKPGETFVATQQIPRGSGTARILDVAQGAKTFSGMCSDVRMFMRLWGLLKVWAATKAHYYSGQKDTIINITTWGKLASLFGYFVLEHGFYLGSKGVLKGYTPQQLGKMFITSIWIYGGYLVLDFIRLYRVTQLARASSQRRGLAAGSRSAPDEKEDKIRAAAESRAWWNALQIDLAYTPLTFHWGIPGGTLSDASVGALGAWAGWVGFKEAWISTS